MISYLLRAAVTAAVMASSGPSWTDQLVAIAAAIAAGAALLTAAATLIAAGAAITALIFARRAARAAGEQVSQARRQVTAAETQVHVTWRQIRQANALERERSRAYVVVFAEPSLVSTEIIEVVIANMGATGAHDVRVSIDPPLVRAPDNAGEAPEVVGLPELLPFLAPGQRWSTVWDSSVVHDGDAESAHVVSTTYRDIFDIERSTTTVLDWSVYDQRLYTDVYGVHHAAKALRGIEKTLSASLRSDKVVRVAAYDGPLRDKQQAADLRRRARHHEDVVARVLPDPEQGPTARMDGTVS